MFKDLGPEGLQPGGKILLIVPIHIANGQSTKQRHKVLPALADSDHVYGGQLEVSEHQRLPNRVHLGQGCQQLAGGAKPAMFRILIYYYADQGSNISPFGYASGEGGRGGGGGKNTEIKF